MDPISIIFALAVGCGLFYLGYLVITKCFPEPIRMFALVLLGLITLAVLYSYATGHIIIPKVTSR